ATLGHNWSSGNLLVAYEAYRRDDLPASARKSSASSDLRPLGGTDHRDTFSYPGNIVRTDPATGGIVPFWGIPPGQSGVGLRPGDFQAGAINRFNQNAGVDVLPGQRRQSAYLALRQSLTPDLELSGDVRYGFRKVKSATNGATSTLTVGRNNPFFVSPNGAATNQIQYAFLGLVGPRFTHAGVQSLSTSLGAELQLPGDWRANGYGAFAQEIIESTQSEGVNSLILAEALGNAPDNPLTAYSAARDGFFNPFAATPAGNSAAAIAAITSGFTKTRYRSNVESADLDADGTVFRLPGGPVKLAAGLQARRETFLNTGSSFSSAPAPTPLTTFDAQLQVAAAFAEVRIPLVGPDNARPGLQSLAVSGALRAEHYSDFGQTVNPRVSVEWSPMSGVKVRGTYGQSFRAPALVELYGGQVYSQLAVPLNGQTVRTLAKQGSNPGLGPETATSWTFGADFEPAALPGLRLAATWFQTDFENRIDRPLASAPRASILTDPRLAPFVQRITPATSAADLVLINGLLADPLFNASQGVFLPTEYVAVTDLRYVNTSGLKVRGIDLQAAYGRDARPRPGAQPPQRIEGHARRQDRVTDHHRPAGPPRHRRDLLGSRRRRVAQRPQPLRHGSALLRQPRRAGLRRQQRRRHRPLRFAANLPELVMPAAAWGLAALAAASLGLGVCRAALAQATPSATAPMTLEEILRGERKVGLARFSPDGRQVLVSVERQDRPSRGAPWKLTATETHVWAVDTGRQRRVGG
ncbi:MAG: TonB-dependent receptor, partial [Phenylobacterium sp.]